MGCGEKSSENQMTVSGTIDGLKKGKLFLQKIVDSTLVSIDSLELRGEANFTFSQELESPEVFYLYLEKADNNSFNDRITFFGEPGEITIATAWNTFDSALEISGSASHEKFTEFNQMITQFNKRDLELVQATTQVDSLQWDSLTRLSDANIKQRYRYVLNFALTNLNSPVAPYVVLSQASDANPKYLDSIANSLSTEVAQTKYGRALKEYVKGL